MRARSSPFAFLWLAASLPAVSGAQPQAAAVVSAADNSSAAEGLAPGSLFTIYGADLAGGSRVCFRTAAAEFDAALLYVSPSQINGVVPDALTPGTAELAVDTAGGESSAQPVLIVPARFAAFTTTGRPFGPAIVQQHDGAGITLNGLLNAAATGNALVIWGTGLGRTPHDEVTVSFGLVKAKPFYAGAAPGLPGVDQINVFLPPGVAGSCFVPFVVTAAGKQSLVYTVSTRGTGGPECSSLFAVGREGLAALEGGGTVRITGMSIEESAAEAWMGEYDAAYLSLLATYDLQPFAAPVSCSRRGYSYDRSGGPVRSLVPPELYGLRRVPDPLLAAVTGPENCSWAFTRGADGVYRAAAPPGCPPRNYSLVDAAAVSSSAGNVPFDRPAPPFPQVGFDAAAGAVAWSGNFSGRLTLELASSFTLPGNIFNGRTEVRELTCRLSGNSGNGLLDGGDLAWAFGLPATRTAVFRQWSGGLTGGSWGGPHGAVFIRILREQHQPVDLR